MLTAGAELAAAIEAPERTVRARLSVDWDADGHGPAGSLDDLSSKAATIVVSSVLQGTQPDQAAVVEGTAAATISVDLAAGNNTDERLRAVRYFSPVSTLSPLAGKERLGRDVQCDVEFLTPSGWQRLPLLRGTSRALQTSVANQSAVLTGIDYRGRLRTPVTLPQFVADTPFYYDPPTVTVPYKPGLEGTWLISYVLWKCGLPLSPPARSGCRWWVPMHGSCQPFIGEAYLGSIAASATLSGVKRAPVFVTGPFVLACEHNAASTTLVDMTGSGIAAGPPIWDSAGRSTGRIEFWIQPTAGSGSDMAMFLYNDLDGVLDNSVAISTTPGGVVQFSITNNSAALIINGPILPADGQWHSVGIHWDDAAGRVTFVLDTKATTATFAPSTAVTGVVDQGHVVMVTTRDSMAEIHITAGLAFTDPWLPTTWDPSADVDRSRLPLDGIIGQAPQEGWQILQELAAAEQAAVYLQPNGRLRYATRASLIGAAAQVPQRTVEASTDILELATDYRLDSVFNVITAPYQPVTAQLRAAVWQASSTVLVPAHSQVTLDVDLQGGLATSLVRIAGLANTTSDGTGTSYPVNNTGSVQVTVALTLTSTTSARIVVTNNLAAQVWLVDTSGQANLTITGDLISQTAGTMPPVVTNEASRAAYGDQPLTMPSSQWVQQRSWAYGLAMATVGDLARPSSVLTGLEIPGDPRLQPFDRMTVLDPANTETAADYWYVGGRHEISAVGEYRQTVAARPARNRFLAGRGLAGVDLVG